MNGIVFAAITELALITWGDVTGRRGPNHTVNGLPLPSDYVAAAIVFGALGFIGGTSEGASRVATFVSWGFVVATALTGGIPSSLSSASAAPSTTASTTGTAPPPAAGTLA